MSARSSTLAAPLMVSWSLRESAAPWLALGLSVLIVFRAMVSIDLFPGWSTDPMILAAPRVSLTPAWLMGIDGVSVVLALGLLSVSPSSRRRTVDTALLLAGVAAVAGHLWLRPAARTPEDLALGSAWTVGLFSAVSLSHAGSMPRVRGVASGVLLGGLMCLAGKAVVQVYVEHPRTLSAFRADREMFLAAQGWEVGSPNALAFERRVSQPEASGWFGLANVLATVSVAVTVALGAVTVLAWGIGGWIRAALVGGTVAALGTLVLAGSKGGVASLAAGCVVLGVVMVAGRGVGRGWVLRVAPLALMAAVPVGVVVRGLAGERLEERSVWFRWMYAEASARIAARSMPMGTGPDGFKDAYLIEKNPLSPEEVTSPHNVILDFISTLGLGGVAWAALVVVMACRLGPSLAAAVGGGRGPDEGGLSAGRGGLGRLGLWVCLGLGLATALGVRIEQALGSPELAAARVGGLLGAAVLGVAVMRVGEVRPWVLAAGLAAGGVPLMMLGLFDLAPVMPSSSPWFFALLGLASSRWEERAEGVASGGGRGAGVPWLGVIAAGVYVGSSAGLAARVVGWERALVEAASAPAEYTNLLARARGASEAGADPEERRRVERDLARTLNLSLGASPEVMAASFHRALTQAAVASFPALRIASERMPAHFPTREAASRMAVELLRRDVPPGAVGFATRRELALEALRLAGPRGGERRASVSAAWYATLVEALATIEPGLTAGEDEVERALQAAHALDPYSASHPAKLAILAAGRGDRAAAARWALVGLRLDENLRLDPIKRLPVGVADRLRALAVGG
ncbi:MAG: O-antigen ligase family protein [Phycisphaeraceae bacterium]|nr:MAG: O-antigen ligase family protein [Phycisphaeraceae bacterium]